MKKSLTLIVVLLTVPWISSNRVRRNPDAFLKTSLERMQMIARLATGIHLQKTLSVGVSSDELLGELLMFGNVTPSSIEAIDEAKVTGAIGALRDLKTSLKGGAEVNAVEANFERLSTMRDHLIQANLADVADFNKNGDFQAAIDGLDANGVDLANYKMVAIWLARVKTMFSEVSLSINYNNAIEVTRVYVHISTLQDVTNNVFSLMDRAELDVLALPTYGKVATAIQMVVAAKAAVAHYTTLGITTPVDQDVATNKQNIELLFKTIKDVNDVVPDIESVQHCVEARNLNGVLRTPRLLFGFTEGERELHAMQANLLDPWMLKVVKTQKFEEALRPLIPLQFEADKAHMKIGDLQEDSLIEILEEASRISPVLTDSSEAITALDGMHACRTALNEAVPPTDIAAMVAAGDAFDTGVANLRAAIENLYSKIEENKQLIQDFSVIADAADNTAAKIQAAVPQITGHPQYGAIRQLFDELKTQADAIQVDSVKTLASAVKAQIAAVTTYTTEVGSFNTFFKCLTPLNGSLVVEKIGEVKAFRDTAQPTVDFAGGISVVQKVKGASPEMQATKALIDGFKGATGSNETKTLGLLADSQKTSEDIGTVTRYLLKLQWLLSIRNQFDVLASNYAQVEAQSPGVTPEEKATLQTIPTVSGAIAAMYAKIDEWKGKVTEPTSSKLDDYHYLVKNAEEVPDVTGDIDAIVVALDAVLQIAQSSQAEIQAVQKALETVSSAELQFASFRGAVDGSKGKLAELEKFFADFVKATTPVKPKSAPPVSSAQDSGVGKEEDEGSNTGLFVGLGVTFLILLLAAAAAAFWFFYLRKRLASKSGNAAAPGGNDGSSGVDRTVAKEAAMAIKAIPAFNGKERVPLLTWTKIDDDQWSSAPINLATVVQFVDEIHRGMEKFSQIDAAFYGKKVPVHEGFFPFCYQFCTDTLLTVTPPSRTPPEYWIDTSKIPMPELSSPTNSADRTKKEKQEKREKRKERTRKSKRSKANEKNEKKVPTKSPASPDSAAASTPTASTPTSSTPSRKTGGAESKKAPSPAVTPSPAATPSPATTKTPQPEDFLNTSDKDEDPYPVNNVHPDLLPTDCTEKVILKTMLRSEGVAEYAVVEVDLVKFDNNVIFILFPYESLMYGQKDSQADFWKQLEAESARHVVTLVEKSTKLVPFWPLAVGDVITLKDVRVVCKHLQKLADMEIRVMVVQIRVESEGCLEFAVTHYLVYGWDEGYAPKNQTALINALKGVQKSDGPVMVQCDFGQEHSGTFAMLEEWKQQMCQPKLTTNWGELYDRLRSLATESLYLVTDVAASIALAVEIGVDAFTESQLKSKEYEPFMQKVELIRQGFKSVLKRQHTIDRNRSREILQRHNQTGKDRQARIEREQKEFEAMADKREREERKKAKVRQEIFEGAASLDALTWVEVYRHHELRGFKKEDEENRKKDEELIEAAKKKGIKESKEGGKSKESKEPSKEQSKEKKDGGKSKESKEPSKEAGKTKESKEEPKESKEKKEPSKEEPKDGGKKKE